MVARRLTIGSPDADYSTAFTVVVTPEFMISLNDGPGWPSFEIFYDNALGFCFCDYLLLELLSLDDSSEKESLDSVCDELDSETCSRTFVL